MGKRSSVSRARVARSAGFALGAWLAFAGGAAAQQTLPPLTEADRALKQCPGQPDAPAILLYRGQTSNQNDWTYSESRRIKVLTEAGKKYGSIEIPFSDAWEVQSVRAAVVRPDGRSVPFGGEMFDKTVVEIGGFKHMVKTFALPDVEAGSIIEYGYDLKLNLKKAMSAGSLSLEKPKPFEGGVPDGLRPYAFTTEAWDIDDPLYTLKAEYTFFPFHSGQFSLGDESYRLGWVSFGLPWGPPIMEGGQVVLAVDHIAAREKEEWAAPEADGRMGVIFFFCSSKILRALDYWNLEGAEWQKAAEKFSLVTDEIRRDGEAASAKAGTELDKIRALYVRAQSITNLSYLHDSGQARRKSNRNAGDVLKSNAGYRSDITRTFVALARAAGFQAEAARVVTRDDKFFHDNILGLYGQFDSEIAIVEVDGREMYFDPATPGCPPGLLRWSATDTTFIRTSGEPGRFFTTPLDPPDRSTVKRRFDLTLGQDNSLAGTASLICTGQEALARRLDHLGRSEEEVKKALAERMTASLPEGGRASVRRIENMANSEDELRVEFEIAIPGAAIPAGDRLILPLVPYKTTWRDSFRHARRTNSVYFPYLCRESDDIVITLPEGIKVETIPGAAKSERTFAQYALNVEGDGSRTLSIRRELTILKNKIASDQYPVLKSFFDQARAGDEGQVILAVEKR
jgi:Domain of Unknown Function with PDB structure (DUF3857)/Transglutaminase-like superfamily